jgi:hypothetical protein
MTVREFSYRLGNDTGGRVPSAPLYLTGNVTQEH